jgi:excisionase family DNA binding protein
MVTNRATNPVVGFDPSLLLTVEETAILLRLGRTQTYELVMLGKIQSVKIGRRRLVVRDSLQNFISHLLDEQN